MALGMTREYGKLIKGLTFNPYTWDTIKLPKGMTLHPDGRAGNGVTFYWTVQKGKALVACIKESYDTNRACYEVTFRSKANDFRDRSLTHKAQDFRNALRIIELGTTTF